MIAGVVADGAGQGQPAAGCRVRRGDQRRVRFRTAGPGARHCGAPRRRPYQLQGMPEVRSTHTIFVLDEDRHPMGRRTTSSLSDPRHPLVAEYPRDDHRLSAFDDILCRPQHTNGDHGVAASASAVSRCTRPRWMRPCSRSSVGAGADRDTNERISRSSTLGATSASPAATTRTARTSSSGSASLSRKPLAPARSASAI